MGRLECRSFKILNEDNARLRSIGVSRFGERRDASQRRRPPPFNFFECLLLHAGQVRTVPQSAAARQSPRALQRAPRSSQVSRPERVLFVVIFHLKEPKLLIIDQGRYYRSQAQEESQTSNKPISNSEQAPANRVAQRRSRSHSSAIAADHHLRRNF